MDFGEAEGFVGVSGVGVGSGGPDSLVVDLGAVGLEEEGEHAFAAIGGAAEGLHLEGFDEPVTRGAPSLGEIVVFVAPVVGGATRDTGQLGCLFYSEAQLVGDEEGLLFEGYFRRVVADFAEISEVVVGVGAVDSGVFGLLGRVWRLEDPAAAADVEAELVASGVPVGDIPAVVFDYDEDSRLLSVVTDQLPPKAEEVVKTGICSIEALRIIVWDVNVKLIASRHIKVEN